MHSIHSCGTKFTKIIAKHDIFIAIKLFLAPILGAYLNLLGLIRSSDFSSAPDCISYIDEISI